MQEASADVQEAGADVQEAGADVHESQMHFIPHTDSLIVSDKKTALRPH